eukprot:scaffold8065_cov267-Pinguiococcus_pyrenoidosus.AAC.10
MRKSLVGASSADAVSPQSSSWPPSGRLEGTQQHRQECSNTTSAAARPRFQATRANQGRRFEGAEVPSARGPRRRAREQTRRKRVSALLKETSLGQRPSTVRRALEISDRRASEFDSRTQTSPNRDLKGKGILLYFSLVHLTFWYSEEYLSQQD